MFKYLFVQLSTTKIRSDSKAAIYHLADVPRVQERGAAVACIGAVDEETFRFMYHLTRSKPGRYHRLRIYVGDCHFLYRMVKAIMHRYWKVGTNFIAETRSVDGTETTEARNYRVAHPAPDPTSRNCAAAVEMAHRGRGELFSRDLGCRFRGRVQRLGERLFAIES